MEHKLFLSKQFLDTSQYEDEFRFQYQNAVTVLGFSPGNCKCICKQLILYHKGKHLNKLVE